MNLKSNPLSKMLEVSPKEVETIKHLSELKKQLSTMTPFVDISPKRRKFLSPVLKYFTLASWLFIPPIFLFKTLPMGIAYGVCFWITYNTFVWYQETRFPEFEFPEINMVRRLLIFITSSTLDVPISQVITEIVRVNNTELYIGLKIKDSTGSVKKEGMINIKSLDFEKITSDLNKILSSKSI